MPPIVQTLAEDLTWPIHGKLLASLPAHSPETRSPGMLAAN